MAPLVDLGIALGALFFLLIVHAMNATWPVLVRRVPEAMAATLPFFFVLFLPIALWLPRLYVWTQPGSIADLHLRAIVEAKRAYLNVPFFLVRAAVFLVFWNVIAFWLGSLSTRQDRDGALVLRERQRTIGSLALPLVGLTVTFAAFDWIMSLTPGWFSTMFGLIYSMCGWLSGVCVLVLIIVAVDRSGLLPGLNRSHYYALGRILLASLVLWGYVTFFQALLIWIANKPSEVTHYVSRVHGSWLAVTWVIIIAHFALPFLALLSYDLKRRPPLLAFVAAWLLVFDFVYVHWLVLPAFHVTAFRPHWLDLAAIAAVSGFALAFGTWRLQGRAMAPVLEPELAAARRYESR